MLDLGHRHQRPGDDEPAGLQIDLLLEGRRLVERARSAPVTSAAMLAQIAAQARVLLGR